MALFDEPKNIVLFSDGTGNSAEKPFKTNVWRTYQALDLETRQADGRYQIANYRNGVGTASLKPLAILGGVFGLGVMDDVVGLYAYLCRNYREGDRIYAFGFSRGAFTIRLLVGLVAKCGLVQAPDENQLFHGVRAAREAFRRDYLLRASQARKMIYHHILAPPCYVADDKIELHVPGGQIWPHVTFLGLWDTVDAYGMPIEELKQGIDRWIWPMSLADRKLSPIVERAFHALSLDDERPTFRPLLWDESDAADKARLEQRWFAGVHANVGGGYPIDDLAYVPLLWMIDKATQAGLWFCAEQVRIFGEMKNVHGTAYDSRAGLAGYYRYGPRSVEKLCDDDRNKVHVALPLVHESVAERIAARHVAYAPISLPRTLALPAPRGGTASQDAAYVDFAWDAVFWRRITYFATLALTLLLLVAPFVHGHPDEQNAPAGRQSDTPEFFAFLPGTVSRFLEWVLGFLPSWASPWTHVFEHHPLVATPLLLLLGWLFLFRSSSLQRSISEISEWAWAGMKRSPTPPVLMPGWTGKMVRKLRMSPRANAFAKIYDEKVIPFVFGFGLLLLLVWFGVWIGWHLLTLPPLGLDVAIGLAAIATSGSFLYNVQFRNFIDAHLGTDAEARVPERRLSYTADGLYAFKTRALQIVLPDRRTLLQTYHGPVLLPNDLIFAVSMGLFVVLLGRRLAVGADHGLWFVVWTASAVLGALYAAADCAEDMLLALVFGSRHGRPRAAALAPWATRIKILCLACSVTGGVMFKILECIGKGVPAKMPSRF